MKYFSFFSLELIRLDRIVVNLRYLDSQTHVLSIQQLHRTLSLTLVSRENEGERERERLYLFEVRCKECNVDVIGKRKKEREKKGEITNNLQTGGLG